MKIRPMAAACMLAFLDTASAQVPLPEVFVTERADRYAPELLPAASRSSVPAEQLPQTVVSVPRQVIDDQGARTVSDALRNVSNVNEIDPRDSNNVGFKIRGFNAAMVIDGVPVPGWFQNQESLVGLRQIDVIKGPAGGLYGSGQAIGNYPTLGGTIAITTKDPEAVASREVGVKAGNFGRRSVSFDLNQPLGDAWSIRVNGEHDRSDSETSGIFFRRTALNPSVAWAPDASTKVIIKARLLDNVSPDYSGLPRASASANEPADGVSRSTYVSATGLPDTSQRSRGLNVQWTQVLSDGWTFKLLAAQSTADIDQRGVFPYPFGSSGLMGSGFGSRVSLFGARLWERLKSETVQASLATQFETGNILHRTSFGIDRDVTRDAGFMAFADPFPMAMGFSPLGGWMSPTDLSTDVRPPWSEPVTPAQGRQQLNRSTSMVAFIQDQLKVGAWHLHGSLRHTRTQADDRYADWGIDNRSTNSRVSPRVGAVFDATELVSLFAGYSETARVPFGSVFSAPPKMEEARQQEIGLRVRGWEGVTGNVALFDLQRRNAVVADPVNLGYSVQAGEQRSRGVDVDLRGQLSASLAWIAAFTRQTAEITEDSNASLAGKRLFNVPDTTARLAARYDVRGGDWSGLGLGLGVTHRSRLAGDTTNTFFSPAVTLWDAQASFTRGGLRYSLGVSNLLNRQYYAPMAYFGGGQVVPGLPRTVVLGVTVQL